MSPFTIAGDEAVAGTPADMVAAVDEVRLPASLPDPRYQFAPSRHSTASQALLTFGVDLEGLLQVVTVPPN